MSKTIFLLFCIIYTNVHISAQSDISSMLEQHKKFLLDSKFNNYLELSNEIAKEYYYNYQSDSSIIVLTEALHFNYVGSVKDSIVAACHHQLGISYYDVLEFEQAIEEWQKAIALREKFLQANHENLIKGNRNIGNSYFEIELYAKAEYYLKKALNLNYSREIPIPKKEAQLNSELGSLYIVEQNIDKASRHLLIAQELYEDIFEDDTYELALIYNKLWSLNELKKDYGKMIEYADRSINLYDPNALDPQDALILASAYNNLAIAYDLQDEEKQAIAYYNKAIDICESHIEDESLMEVLSLARSNVSTAFSNLGEFDEAILHVDKAISLNSLTGNKSAEVRSLENKAEIYIDKSELPKALETIDRALNIIKENQAIDSLSDIDSPTQIFVNRTKIRILNLLSDQTNDLAYLENTMSLIHENSELIDQVRHSVQSEKSKTFLSVEAKSIIEEGITTLIKLNKRTNNSELILKAWELSEKAKSIILLESLRTMQARKKSDVNNIFLLREDSLNKELAIIEREIYNNQDNAVNLNKDYLRLSNQLSNLSDKINVDSPKYISATKDLSNISLKESLKAYDSDIIEYFLGDHHSFVFVKTNEELACYPLDSINRIINLVSKVRKATVENFSYSANKGIDYTTSIRDYSTSAHELYNLLFRVIDDSEDLEEKILIIPDGVLGYLPFDLLLTKESTNEDFSSKPYLLHNHNISYTYSIALLDEMTGYNRARADKNLLAIAPLFESNKEVYLYGNREIKKEVQPPLYFNKEEIESIHNIIGGDMITGHDATEEHFLAHAQDYNILHLSTHGKANDEIGSFSYLAFTEILDSTENEFVYNYDLYNLNLNADMVVLSACETGLGELKAGEGIISLARGFSYAGAKSIINTLWTINDYRTKEIMESFYTGIADGQDKDVALRAAKLKFIKDNPSEALPFYWAAFIPVGDMSAIENNVLPKNSIYYIMALCGLLLVVLFLKSKHPSNYVL